MSAESPTAPNHLFRAARLRLFGTQQELADAANAHLAPAYLLTGNDIGKLERGIVSRPSAPRRQALRTVCGVKTDAELGFSRRGQTFPRVACWPQTSNDVASPGSPPQASILGETGIATGMTAGISRRDLMSALAAVVTSCGLLADQPGPRRRIGASDIARLKAITSLYRTVDHQYGGGVLADDVARFAQAASTLQHQLINTRLRADLLAAIADARYLAGWAAFDTTRYLEAHRHFAAAERAAVDAGSLLLAAHVRYGQARLLQHQRHNYDALDVLVHAHSGLQPTPGILTVLRGAEAASRAAVGDFDGADRALGQADDAFTAIRPGTEPEWLGFLDEGELLAQHGRVWRDRARANPGAHGDIAVERVLSALDGLSPESGRSNALNQVGLASAYFLAGAPALAIAAGKLAQKQAGDLASPRVIDRIARLRYDAAAHLDSPQVADFVHTLPVPAA